MREPEIHHGAPSHWTIGPDRLLALEPFALMGIVNVTPDSFSDGGNAFDADAAIAQALRLAEEGAQIVLTNAPVALRMGEINKLAEQCGNAPVIGADVTNMDDLKNLFEQSMQHFGGPVDFVLHSIGMSLNVRKGKHYTEMNYEWNQKTMDISAMSLHRVLRTAWDLDAIREGGSVVALSYIAAQRVFPDYNELADAKALLESVTRSFGYHYGVRRKVRVNTVSQSPTRTTAGSGVKGFDGFINYAEAMSPLGNASGEDCANYCVTLFSDMTRFVTMQNLFHDGGFSFTGVTQEVIEKMG